MTACEVGIGRRVLDGLDLRTLGVAGQQTPCSWPSTTWGRGPGGWGPRLLRKGAGPYTGPPTCRRARYDPCGTGHQHRGKVWRAAP